MSRIGKQPVVLPDKVKAAKTGDGLMVEGPHGKLQMVLPKYVDFRIEDKRIVVTRAGDEREARAAHGLTRALIRNMVQGVTEGYQKELQVEGVGYRAELKGNLLSLSMGFSRPVVFTLPEGVKAKVDKQTTIILSGADKALVGQVAANIRQVRPPEPYKGKGIRYAGEQVQRKAGKTAAGSTGGGAK